MTDEQINQRIAEACGWQFIPEYYHGKDQPPEFTTVTPDGRHLCGYYPDYLNDLNAMHDAEKILSPTSEIEWHNQLQNVCGCSWRVMIRATAAQRAEAFLRTLGRWEEEA